MEVLFLLPFKYLHTYLLVPAVFVFVEYQCENINMKKPYGPYLVGLWALEIGRKHLVSSSAIDVQVDEKKAYNHIG